MATTKSKPDQAKPDTAAQNTSWQSANWMESGKQYWEGLFEAQRKAMEEQTKTFGGMQGQWGQFFNQWQTMTSGGSTNTAQPGADMYKQVFVKAGENYIKMMEQFYQSAGQSKTPEDAVKEWMGGMQKFFESAMSSNGQPYDVMAQYKTFTDGLMNGGPSFWTSAFKNPMMGDSPTQAQTSALFDPFGFYASLPGIGYSREKQEHQNKLYRLFVDYEGGMRKYNMEMSKVGMKALYAFSEYLKNPPTDAAPLESLKSIYAKWTDVCEGVFAEYAMSDEYTTMYGDVVNALMAFKKQMHIIADDTVEQMNLPTRAEVDSLHKKVQELKRDNFKLQKAVEELLGKKTSKKGEQK